MPIIMYMKGNLYKLKKEYISFVLGGFRFEADIILSKIVREIFERGDAEIYISEFDRCDSCEAVHLG